RGRSMPRPNLGPKLTAIRKKGWTRTVFYIRWTEDGRTRWHGRGIDAADSARAADYFQEWLRLRAKARRKGPGDPDQVWVRDVIEDYAKEHGRTVAAPETVSFSAAPLLHFFARDTIATLTTNRVREYWTWRAGHSMETVDKATGTMRVIERTIASGTIIRDLAGVLRPAIKHAVEQRRLAAGVYHVPVPPAPTGREYWITRAEAARLLWETRRDPRARLHLPLYTMIALYTGQRRGAILDLTWQQIDLPRGRIDFNPPG